MAWKDLSERQKDLDRKIESCGIKLEDSERCLAKVMRAVDAEDYERDFVKQRIILRLRTQQVLSETDGFIERTEKMLEDFKRDEEEWERRGRALGFKFWDKK